MVYTIERTKKNGIIIKIDGRMMRGAGDSQCHYNINIGNK